MLSREAAAHRLAAHDQQHVLRWFDELSPDRQQQLLRQIANLDLAWLERVLAAPPQARPREIRPVPSMIRPDGPDAAAARLRGEQALREGRVACLLVAGGQGTRLGFDGPKGDYPIGPVSRRTLFQLHVDRLHGLGRRYGTVPPLYLMTGPDNHRRTCEIFAEHQRYGLAPDRLSIFEQGVAPAVDTEGRLLMAARDSLVLTPNGNGGLFAALRDSGALDQMADLGIETISYIQVDNALALSCDPLFVGVHLQQRAQFSCKAIAKTGPAEKVGNFASIDGRLGIVEYTELPEELARATGPDGELLFGFGNPGLFLWSVDFARAQAERADLPFHRAHKKIPHLDAEGRWVEPQQPSGYKLESFALDTLVDAERTALLLCPRDAEFAPVKNASGVDSPRSAQQLICALYRGWVERCGGRVKQGVQLEINPRYALDEDELGARLPAGFIAEQDTYLA